MDVPKETRECAFNVGDKKNCMEDDVLVKLQNYANTKGKKENSEKTRTDLIDELKNELHCENESCLFTKQEIRDVIGPDVAKKQLETRYKPEGPFNSNDWFSNVHIDSVLEQVAIQHKDKNFLHIPFQMRDFQEVGGSLSKIDLVAEYKRGIRCFGVVFNTDITSRNGEHWFSVFGDFTSEPFTIEYFNSTGQAALPQITSWMKLTKMRLEKELNKKVKDIEVSKIQNQNDNHSCGSYSLYYILSRLDGISYEHFTKNKIGDNAMHMFRKYHLFRQPI
jgi:hypothetical protein